MADGGGEQLSILEKLGTEEAEKVGDRVFGICDVERDSIRGLTLLRKDVLLRVLLRPYTLGD